MADAALEELVLQALGHKERRRVIKMIGFSEGGMMYSDILHELAINTGKLNYHLKLLEGLIEKDEKRRYQLTKIGEKAYSILDNITRDLDEEFTRIIPKVKAQRDEFVSGIVTLYTRLIFVSLIFLSLGFEILAYFYFKGDIFNPTAITILILPILLLIAEYWYLNKLKLEAPEAIISFLQRLGFYK